MRVFTVESERERAPAMRQFWPWLWLPMVLGWQLMTPNDVFFDRAREDIDALHRTLVRPDSYQTASDHVHETVHSKGAENSGGGAEAKDDKSTLTLMSGHGKSKSHKEDAGHKGHSSKENLSKKYGESSGKKQNTHSHGGHRDEHHMSHEGGKGGFFKDKLLYKKGNYEKGYRDKYHLDEVLKHDQFWNNHHSLDKFHKYGTHGSQYHKVQHKKENHHDKKESDEKNDHGKKGETSGGSSSSEHKGHKSKKGVDTHYQHKNEYHKKKP